ncbi:MAG: cupin domain-containing protein [Candidatus Methanoperedens sp.]|nr:cupin domain-containing protein [Candidatus Methanoperedens nitroreducens]MDJ1420873.1 cupin domain-containing protein [Candidatus Methanoperedens sp.]
MAVEHSNRTRHLMYVKQIENGLDLTGIAKSVAAIYDTSLEPGQSIQPHYHPESEEIYYILSGYGIMTIGDEKQEISRGDVVYIPASAPHTLLNTGSVPLRFMTVSAKGDR